MRPTNPASRHASGTTCSAGKNAEAERAASTPPKDRPSSMKIGMARVAVWEQDKQHLLKLTLRDRVCLGQS